MKTKKMNALMALLLVFTLVFGQAGAVYAAEPADMPASVESSTEEAEIEDKEEPVVSDEEDNTGTEVEEDGSETSDESNTESENKEETETNAGENGSDTEEKIETPETVGDENEAPQEGKTEEDQTPSMAGEEPEAEDTEDIKPNHVLSVDKQKNLDALGFKTMALSQEMMKEKSELSEVVSALSLMEAGKDYVENEIIYAADSEEKAAEIAECYGGTLAEYEYGIATVNIEKSVVEAVDVAADMEVPIPAVYPNLVIKIDGNWEAALDENNNTTSEHQFLDAEDVEHKEEIVSEETDIVYLDEKPYALSPTDPGYNDQWYHEKIGTVGAWDATKGSGVTVAVLDSGVDYNHPDLKENIKGHLSLVDSTDGMDVNGHGTHCAGIIAARQNDIGGVGIAPEAGIYGIKVLDDSGYGFSVDSIRGVRAAIEGKVDVISMSFGSLFHLPIFQDAIDAAVKEGIVVVAASGNEATSQKSYPAAYENVISVAASDNDNDLTSFSNFGTWVDIAAPGYEILSTFPNDKYVYLDGTSMACPVVAGTVALMVANSSKTGGINSEADVEKISKNLLANAGGKVSSYTGAQTGSYPLVDVEAATYAADMQEPQKPEIKFNSQLSSDKVPKVKAGDNESFTFDAYGKIYYTINGKKPTVKTGIPYYKGTGIRMNRSGKVKIQAITVIGNKVSPLFSQTYFYDAPIAEFEPTCNDQMSVVIGKSIQLGVNIGPSYATNKKLTWQCESESGNIKVNAKGKVTCNKHATPGETATVTVETQDASEFKNTFTITAVEKENVTLTLNETSVTIMTPWQYYFEANEIDPAVLDACKNYPAVFKLEANSGGVTEQYTYKSSNPKVAAVDEDGYIVGLKKGTAKITVTTNDGSGKKATCKVTVKVPVFDLWTVSSTGYVSEVQSDGSLSEIPIATGCSITMKTEVNYNSKNSLFVPTNKSLEWVSSNPSAVTVKNGKVTCKPNAEAGTTVDVTITAKDKCGISKRVRFCVVDKVESIYLKDDDGIEYAGLAISQILDKNVPRNLEVGDVLSDPIERDDIWIKTRKRNPKVCWEFTSKASNKDVVYRYYDSDYGVWAVAATKEGTSTLTYTMRDGSNKTFKVKFTVDKASTNINKI